MVVRIKPSKSVRRILSYNEEKVGRGVADLILAAGFACDINSLGFSEKLRRFEALNARRETVKSNTLHITLNFPPDEILETETLQRLAMDYMDRIGFGGQPYLVYEHTDATHPHIHIVTTTIQASGKPINQGNLAKEKSEPARKALEMEYGLIPAESRKRQTLYERPATTLDPTRCTRPETKRELNRIVSEVIPRGQYCDLEEINALLRCFNVIADRGSESSFQFKIRGLTYCLLDEEGYKVGIPIKASQLAGTPTLVELERKFARNLLRKQRSLPYAAKKIGSVFGRSRSPEELLDRLQAKNIKLLADRDRTGSITKFRFVDQSTLAVYDSVDLGIDTATVIDKLTLPVNPTRSMTAKMAQPRKKQSIRRRRSLAGQLIVTLVTILLAPTSHLNQGGGQFPRKKKKKRRGPSLS